MRTFSIALFREDIIVLFISELFTEIPTRSFEREFFILSTTSSATLFSRRVISNSGKSSSNCS